MKFISFKFITFFIFCLSLRQFDNYVRLALVPIYYCFRCLTCRSRIWLCINDASQVRRRCVENGGFDEKVQVKKEYIILRKRQIEIIKSKSFLLLSFLNGLENRQFKPARICLCRFLFVFQGKKKCFRTNRFLQEKRQ